MARQVVSYDDLAPSDIPLQATSPNVTTSPSEQVAANGTGSVSPTRKRRRDEGVSEGKVTRNVDMDFNNVHEDGAEMTSGNPSSSQTLPRKPQVKKRGKNKRHFGGGGSGIGMGAVTSEAPHKKATAPPVVQHWDDPGVQTDEISYDEGSAEVNNGTGDHVGASHQANGEEGEAEMELEETEYVNEDEDEEDENRELTHEEIWDDSALIAAWDAANEEYEAIHGKNKRWKKERIHKSPLWYNIPPEKPKASLNKGKGKAKRNTVGPSSTAIGSSEAKDVAGSSMPLNFETYVPTHDPSLTFPTPPSPPSVPEPTQAQLRSITSQYSSMIPASLHINSSGSDDASTSANLAALGAAGISADEAFSRAIGAMYWCGYWTAVYNVQRAYVQGTTLTTNNPQAEDSTEVQGEGETVELVSTQR